MKKQHLVVATLITTALGGCASTELSQQLQSAEVP